MRAQFDGIHKPGMRTHVRPAHRDQPHSFLQLRVGRHGQVSAGVPVRLCIDVESGLHPLFVVFTLGFESCQDIQVTPDRCRDRVPGQPHRCSFEELFG